MLGSAPLVLGKSKAMFKKKQCVRCPVFFLPNTPKQKYCRNCNKKGNAALNYNPKEAYRERLDCEYKGCHYKFIKTKEGQTQCLTHNLPEIR